VIRINDSIYSYTKYSSHEVDDAYNENKVTLPTKRNKQSKTNPFNPF